MATETHTFTLPAPVPPIEHESSMEFEWTAQLRGKTEHDSRYGVGPTVIIEIDVRYTVHLWGLREGDYLDFELESVETDAGFITAKSDPMWFKLFIDDAYRNDERIREMAADHIAQSDRHERSRDND